MTFARAALLGAALMAGAAAAKANGVALETVAKLELPPGNIAVTPDGLVVVSVQGAYGLDDLALAVDHGKARPFPSEALAKIARKPGDPGLRSVLGIRADKDGKVWMLSGGAGQPQKILYAWDVRAGRLAREYKFEAPVARPTSFFNDIALALQVGAIFVSDPAGDNDAAIVVIDAKTGEGRRVLEGHPSVRSEDITATIAGRVMGNRGPDGGLRPLRGAVNPITIDPKSEWIYYGAMSGTSLYRARVADLLDNTLAPEELAKRVQRYGDKPPSAGITIDDAGNVYVTDVQAFGVGVTTPDGKYRLLVSDRTRLDWPDGLSAGPDGYIYVCSNALYRRFASHADTTAPAAEFYVTRFKALAPVTIGR